MRAMILAAGRGERLRPLTDTCPKPLVKVKDKALIIYHLEALAKIGIKQVVINVAYLKEQIQNTLGTGQKWGMEIMYSVEENVLETGGGIVQALPLLGDEPFILISADILTQYPLEHLYDSVRNKKVLHNTLAHLVLVDNPEYNAKGDFGLDTNKMVVDTSEYTYANIGVYKPAFFKDCTPGVFPLAPLLYSAIDKGLVSGEYYAGPWVNIGTVEQLKAIELESERIT